MLIISQNMIIMAIIKEKKIMIILLIHLIFCEKQTDLNPEVQVREEGQEITVTIIMIKK